MVYENYIDYIANFKPNKDLNYSLINTVTTNSGQNNGNVFASSHPAINLQMNNNNFSVDDNNRINNEIVPPIQDMRSKVFSSPGRNVLAKSRRIKKKKRRVITSQYPTKGLNSTNGMWSAFPGRKLNLKKSGYSRGLSVNSGKSSRSRRKYKSSSRSSRSSRSRSSKASSTTKRHKSNVRRMKKRYIRNVLPHVNSHGDKEMIMREFTNPS